MWHLEALAYDRDNLAYPDLFLPRCLIADVWHLTSRKTFPLLGHRGAWLISTFLKLPPPSVPYRMHATLRPRLDPDSVDAPL